MGNATGQGPNSLHFLSLLKLMLKAHLLFFNQAVGFDLFIQVFVGLNQFQGPPLDAVFKFTVDLPHLFLFLGQQLLHVKIFSGIIFNGIAGKHTDDIGADEKKVVIDQHGKRSRADQNGGKFVKYNDNPTGSGGPDKSGANECVAKHENEDKTGVVRKVGRGRSN